jgi:hypothetical protein
MHIFQIARETVFLARAYKCVPHDWERLNATEEQCKKCGIIATEQGKSHLEAESKRRGFAV